MQRKLQPISQFTLIRLLLITEMEHKIGVIHLLLYAYSMICCKARALPVLSDFCERNSYAAQLSRLHTLIMYFSLSLRYFVCFWVIS